MLEELGDLAGAEAAYRRADERGESVGAMNLGALLEEHGDLAGAEAAYRRADELGHADGARCLAALLEQRGDLAGARALPTAQSAGATSADGRRAGSYSLASLGPAIERSGAGPTRRRATGPRHRAAPA